MEKEIIKEFQSIDKDLDGKITQSEFEDCLKICKLPVSQQDVLSIFNKIDKSGDGVITFEEFVEFYMSRSKEIQLMFDRLSIRDCSERRIDKDSLNKELKSLGFRVTDFELESFLKLLDSDKDGKVNFEEFREALLLLPDVSHKTIFDSFRSNYAPIEFSQSEYSHPIEKLTSTSSLWLSQLTIPSAVVQFCSGGIGGIVSRTGTAPIDRIKTLMQVCF